MGRVWISADEGRIEVGAAFPDGQDSVQCLLHNGYFEQRHNHNGTVHREYVSYIAE
jgi:hypothetical protein